MSRATSSAASARSAASRVQDNQALQLAARTGFAVNGLLHLIIGGIAIGVAFGSSGEADQSGALNGLASNPGGVFVLWVVALGMFALGLFQVLETFIVRGTYKEAWAARAKEAGKAIAYLAIGLSATNIAMGSRGDSSGQAQRITATMLSTPGGVFLVVLLGLGVLATGVYFIVKGGKQRFLQDISAPAGKTGRLVTTLGRIGYIAKGVAISVVGLFFCTAAFTSDPSEATGLDGALKALVDLPFGQVILTVVALGLMAYGVYCFVRARYAQL